MAPLSTDDPGGFAASLYALTLLAFPRPLREQYGAEMRHAFAAALRRRRTLGAAGARRYARRALLDALVAGLRARLGDRGVTRTRPRSPLGRLAHRSFDMLVNEIWTDVRLSVRTLAKSPAFTVTVLLVLALGIGINGSIFSAVETAILADPPYPDPDRLVLVDLSVADVDNPGPPRAFPWSYPKFEILAATPDRKVDPVAAYATRNVTLTERGDPVQLRAEVVTPDYFRVLALAQTLGRDFSAPGGEPEREIVLGEALWRERFGADPDVVGDRAMLNGEPMVVIGVAPAGFRGLSGNAALWIPMDSVPFLVNPNLLSNFDGHWLAGVGRLAPGATLEEARSQLQSVAARVDETYPWSDPTERIGGDVRRLADARRNPAAQRAVLVVGGAAGLVLLIACANLAALMLARSLERRRETAVRLALGASRGRIVRAVLTETVLLGTAGGLLGILVASQGIRAIAAAWPQDFMNAEWNLRFVDPAGFSLDTTTVVYTLALALLAGLVFGLGPALRLSGQELGSALKEGARGSGAGERGHGRGPGGRRLLVVAEIALAMVLLVGAGLMISSLGKLLAVDPGFDPQRLLTFSYSLPRSSPAADAPLAFHEAFLERIRALPGVENASIGCPPLAGIHCWITGVRRAGDRTWEESEQPRIGVEVVGVEFRDTLGIDLLAGRWLEPEDNADSAPVVVLSESAARRLYPDGNPLGQPFAAGIGINSDGATAEVVGVVSDILFDTQERGIMPELYASQRQEGINDLGVDVVVRTAGDPLALMPQVRAALVGLDASLAISGVTTVEDLAAGHVSDTRAVMGLLSLFAAVALVLAAVGVWGIVAYSVSLRRRELGIRMALGAEASSVVGMILRQGLSSALWGVAIGVGAGSLSTRLLSSLLYEVSTTDGRVFAAGVLVLLAVAALAAYLPARRVARVNPVEAVRAE